MLGSRRIVHRGKTLDLTFEDDVSLLDVVQGALAVRSASRGCQDGSCGTCRVLVDGRAVNACKLPWRDVASGACIESHEDVSQSPPVQRALAAFDLERPTRCSLCVTAEALERAGKAGDADAVEAALVDATCVCTGRGSLRRALLSSR